MFSKTMIAAGLIAATTLIAVPANAGVTVKFGFGAPGYGWNHAPHGHGWKHAPYGHGWQHKTLSQRDVSRILHRQGYRHVQVLDRRGPVYQVRARKFGRAFYLVVSARNGAILSQHRA